MAYFPKLGRVLSINAEAWAFLERLKKGICRKRLSVSDAAVFGQLKQMGLVVQKRTFPGRRVQVREKPTTYAPSRAALLLTSRCNLRCKYCYSSAGSTRGAQLSLEASKAAVDLIVENARKTGERALLVLHGGGEPSCAWPLIKTVVEYFEERTASAKVERHVAIATNGVIPRERLVWLAEHLNEFCISLDGPPVVQDRQRPKAGGTGSFADVERTLTYLDDHGKNYFLMTTVTSESLPHLGGLIPLVTGRRGCRAVFLAPVYPCGIGTKYVSIPSARDFIKAHRALLKAVPAELSVSYIGASAGIVTDVWCDATAANTSFDVTPEGLVTCCYMVTDASDPKAKLFMHGRYDAASGKYVFNPEAQARLHSRNVETVPACRDCFCKFSCASGCLNQAPALYRVNRYRCTLNRTLTMDQLIASLPGRKAGATMVRLAASGGKDLEAKDVSNPSVKGWTR